MAKNRLTCDQRTGLYRRDLGWKDANRGYLQHRFYLGRDAKQAAVANARLQALWDKVEARWRRDQPG